MHKLRFFLLLSLFAAVICPAAEYIHVDGLTSGYDVKAGIEASVSPLFPAYLEKSSFIMRVKLENKSSSERNVECRFSSRSYSVNGIVVARRVTLPPGNSKIIDLPFPRIDSNYYNFKLEVHPEGYSVIELKPGVSSTYSYSDNKSQIFISRGVPRDEIQKGFDAIENSGKKSHFSSDKTCRLFRENDFPEPWRTDWRAYLPFDLWVIAEQDYAALSASVRTSIKDFVAAGGRVCLFGFQEIPAELNDDSRAKGSYIANGEATVLNFGNGQYFAYKPATPSAISTNMYNVLFAERQRFYNTQLGHDVISDFYPELKGAKFEENVPIGLFALLLNAFLILAGPVTLVVLARKNKRIYVVWVIPVLGLVFGISVILSILFIEGVAPRVVRTAVTTLYQREKRAVSDEMVAVYSPFSLGSPIKFGIDDEVTVIGAGSLGSGCVINCGNEQEYSPSFVRPRMAQCFTVRRCGVENRRIEVSRDGGNVKIVNALGVRIKKLQLSDGNNAIFSGEDIMPGAVAVLNRDTLPGSGNFRRVFDGYGNSKRAFYCAELDGCPFFENPLRDAGAENKESATLVGYFDFQEEGAAK